MGELWLSVFIKRREKLYSVKKNSFIQVIIYENKKEIAKYCFKLYIKVNLPIEFKGEKYNLNCKSHTYKIKAITTQEMKFSINNFFSKCDHLLNKSLMENFIFCAVYIRNFSNYPSKSNHKILDYKLV